MENKLQIFTNAEFGELRVVEIKGEIYFVGKDVAEILGHKNPQAAIRGHVDDEDKGVSKILTPGGVQNTIVINESGLYSLILSSKLPTAKKFKRWVTSELLPSIRKHGIYATENFAEQAIKNPAWAIEVLNALRDEQKKRIEAENLIEEQKPKVIFADAVSASQSSILVGDLAKLLNQNGINIGQNRLFEVLRNNGYLINRKGSSWNMPTQKSMELKLFEVKERTIDNPDGSIRITRTTKVTGKGQIYFINKLKKITA